MLKDNSPRTKFTYECSASKWIYLCNTALLMIVAIMCILVIHEIQDLDQRFVQITDSSAIAIDIIAADLAVTRIEPAWRKVTEKLSVYSAFYNMDDVDAVWILGFYDGETAKDIRCLLKYDNEEVGISIPTVQKSGNCGTVILRCSTSGYDAIPNKVTVVSLTKYLAKQWIHIKLIEPYSNEFTNVAVCVEPLEEDVHVQDVSKFVDFHEKLGVRNFYFYNHNASKEVNDNLMELYRTGHSIHSVRWNTRQDKKEICKVTLKEYVHDCMFRARGNSNYVITLSVFDYFVSKNYATLSESVSACMAAGSDTSALHIKKNNFCKYHDPRKNIPASIKNMVFRSDAVSFDNNYVLSIKDVPFINNVDSKDVKVDALPEDCGKVHSYAGKCSLNATLDTDAYKYILPRLSGHFNLHTKTRINT